MPINLIIGAIIRGILQLVAGGTIVATDDIVTQIAGGVVAAGTLGWSLYQKRK